VKYVKYEWEAIVPACGEIYGIFVMDMNQFNEGGIRKRAEEMTNWDREDLIEGMFQEFSVSTFEMILERKVGEKNVKSIVRLTLNTDFRKNIRKLMEDEEKRGHLKAEDEMNSQMNPTPEMFVHYMMAHNLWIAKEMDLKVSKIMQEEIAAS
jgi:hypothetical protein